MTFEDFLEHLVRNNTHIMRLKKKHGYISSIKLNMDLPIGECVGPFRSLGEINVNLDLCRDLSYFYELLSNSDTTNI